MHRSSNIRNPQLCKFLQSEHTHITTIQIKDNTPITHNAFFSIELITHSKVNTMFIPNTKY